MSKILKGKELLTLGYGNQKLNGSSYNHKGIDVVKTGYQLDDIIALEEGTVISIKDGIAGFINNSYGNYVYLQHDNGYRTFYAHLKKGSLIVKKGDKVKKGQVLGYMGATGMAYGAHLHFEVEKDGKLINPYDYVFRNSVIKKPEVKKPEVKKDTLKVGDIVVPIKKVDYMGTPLIQWDSKYEIMQIDKRGAVLGAVRGNNRPTWAVLKLDNLRKV